MDKTDFNFHRLAYKNKHGGIKVNVYKHDKQEKPRKKTKKTEIKIIIKYKYMYGYVEQGNACSIPLFPQSARL